MFATGRTNLDALGRLDRAGIDGLGTMEPLHWAA